MSYLQKLNAIQAPPFLCVYTDIARGSADSTEVKQLYSYLSKMLKHDPLSEWFKDSPDQVDLILAIDAVAHEMHSHRPELYKTLFNGDISVAKEALDDLAGMEIEESGWWRRPSRDYFAKAVEAAEKVEFIQDAAPSDVDISDEVERLMKHHETDPDLITPAQRISLARLGHLKKTGEKEPLVIGGWASIEMIDKEGHLITTEALTKAFDDFMKSRLTRNVMILHSDVQAGWVLPFYVCQNGGVKKSQVTKKGLYIVCEVRDDLSVVDRIKKEIEKGRIRSFSIAGSAKDKVVKTTKGRVYYQINSLQLAEISLCEVPVNPNAHFAILKAGETKS